MKRLQRFSNLDVYGCDISDYLLTEAKKNGISGDRLEVTDATHLSCYPDDAFQHSYSIGSLEHFTESQIDSFLVSAKRVTTQSTMHMVPVAKKNQNEGWITTTQSYFNNTPKWWTQRFESSFKTVQVLPSTWTDQHSNGIWIVATDR